MPILASLHSINTQGMKVDEGLDQPTIRHIALQVRLFVQAGLGPEVITLLMLTSAEHEIYPAHKCLLLAVRISKTSEFKSKIDRVFPAFTFL